MTVRSWITISVLALVALSGAVVYQFLRPIEPPPIVVHAGSTRVGGLLTAGCWPQRSGNLRCTRSERRPAAERIERSGRLRVVFAYPAEPKDGSITITDAEGETVLREGWERLVRYDLDPGTYTLTAQAGASDGAYVRYVFALRVM